MDRQAAEMDCIALVSFTHTRTPPQATSFVDNQAAEMDCIALVSFTHTRTPPTGLRMNWGKIMAAQSIEKWKARFQGCQPTAHGNVGNLDGDLAFGMGIGILNAQPTSQAASQATCQPDRLTLRLIHFGHLAQVGAV
jgi:hypothetical protein